MYLKLGINNNMISRRTFLLSPLFLTISSEKRKSWKETFKVVPKPVLNLNKNKFLIDYDPSGSLNKEPFILPQYN